MKYHAIVLAGGNGERFGLMKQFVPLDGKPIFIRTLEKFTNPDCQVTLVVPRQFLDVANNCLHHYDIRRVNIAFSGDTRQGSMLNALNSITSRDYWGSSVLITDANRPLLSLGTIENCLSLLADSKTLAVLTVCKSINTSCTAKNLVLDKILDRSNMFELLMPQCFDLSLLREAHNKTKLKNSTDDMQIILSVFPKVKAYLYEVSFWEGLKLTHPADYKVFEALL